MTFPTRLTAALAVGALAVGGLAACGDDEDDSAATPAATPAQTETTPAESDTQAAGQDIVALAQATPDLSTLVTAVTAADLVETLQGDGPFTVFAPSNAAFEAANDVVAPLLEPDAKEQLADVLTYHVVPQKLTAADLTDGAELETVQGGTLNVAVDGDTVTVNDIPVEMADVEASNGVVHVIGGVLVPES
jgi:uncharacterized surface protein with fasciclin (FAS1) repeats